MKAWSVELLNEYKEGRSELKEAVKALNDEIERDKTDKRILSSAIRDMDFSIEWLETGQMPVKSKTRIISDNPTWMHKKNLDYGISGYWDDSVGAFVNVNSYKNPFREVEDKIDRELEMKRNV